MAKLMTGTSKTTLSAADIAAKREEAARKLREAEEAAREADESEETDEENEETDANGAADEDVQATDEEIEQIKLDGDKRYAWIVDLAERLNDDDKFLQEVHTNVEADKRKKYGLLPVLFDMRRVLKEEMVRLPIPGTDAKTSNNPDEYMRLVRDEKTGFRKPRKRSFYLDLAECMSEGAAAIALRTKINNKEDEFAKMSDEEREACLANPTSALNTVKNNLRKAAALHWQLCAVDDLKACNVGFIDAGKKEGYDVYDEKGVGTGERAIKSPVPLILYDNGKPPKTAAVSITTFLTYDIRKAKENGGNLQAVLDTRKRDGERKELKIKVDMPTETFFSAAGTMLNWVDDQKRWAKALKEWNKADNASDVRTFGDLFLFLNDNFWPKYKTKYNAIVDAEKEAAQKEADEKARKRTG